ncbi:hypothetical protein BaRGS_00020734 [Batillaria attramentaria]|uniref:Uncharacterized protein n=1 Tax=Batillaria attramentaria TaxID=370345 RepID=A0ABD0KLJ3_9CAEN
MPLVSKELLDISELKMINLAICDGVANDSAWLTVTEPISVTLVCQQLSLAVFSAAHRTSAGGASRPAAQA